MAQLRFIEVSADNDSAYWEITCPPGGVRQFTEILSDVNPAIRGYLRVYREDGATGQQRVTVILPKRVIKRNRLTGCVAKTNGMLGDGR